MRLLNPIRGLLGALRAKRGSPQRRRDVGRAARVIVCWGFLTFVLLQVGLNLFMEARHSEVYDPEYRDRLIVLRERVRESPERPVLLVVGSSRLVSDFQPEQLPPLGPPDRPQPLPFNMSHTGSGPLLNLLFLQRTLRAGITPKWVVVEVVPAMLGASGQSSVAKVALGSDLPVLGRYMPWPKLYGIYAADRVRAGYIHRDAFFRHCTEPVRTARLEWDAFPLAPLGGVTQVPNGNADAAEVRRMTAVVKAQYYPGLQRLEVRETADRATRELLVLCRERGIGVVLLLTPESSEFRGWYPPEAKRAVADYCEKVRRECGVPVVDTREWIPDADFVDGHHTGIAGACKFTHRLGEEVLRPLVEGRAPLAARP